MLLFCTVPIMKETRGNQQASWCDMPYLCSHFVIAYPLAQVPMLPFLLSCMCCFMLYARPCHYYKHFQCCFLLHCPGSFGTEFHLTL